MRKSSTDKLSTNIPAGQITEQCFGAELFRIRTEVGLTQSCVAAKASLARGYYSQIENSKKIPPPVHTVCRIAQALGMDQQQAQYLHFLANIERCAAVQLPIEMPQFVAGFIRRVSASMHLISADKLRWMEAVLEEGLSM